MTTEKAPRLSLPEIAAEAIPVLEKAVSLTDRGPGAISVLIRAYAHAGRRPEALKPLAELKRRNQTGYVPTGAFVNAYLGLGDNEPAFVWLERGYQEQSNPAISEGPSLLRLNLQGPSFQGFGPPRRAPLRLLVAGPDLTGL